MLEFLATLVALALPVLKVWRDKYVANAEYHLTVEGQREAKKQAIDDAVASGDARAVSEQLHRLFEKARDRRDPGQPGVGGTP